MRYFTFFFVRSLHTRVYFALTAHLKVSQPPAEQGLSSHTWPSATTHGSTVQGPPLEMDAPSGWVLTWTTPHQARNAAYWPEVQTRGSDRPWSPCVCACVAEAVINAHFEWSEWQGIQRGNPVSYPETSVECFFLASWGLRTSTYLGWPSSQGLKNLPGDVPVDTGSTPLHDTHRSLDKSTLLLVLSSPF